MKFPSQEQRLYFYNYLVSKFFKKKDVIKTIMVVKWDEFGDMATTTHVFQLLKEEYPSAKLTLLCKPEVSSLVANDPYIDNIITSIDSWNSIYDVVVELRGTIETLRKSLKYKPKYRCDRGTIRFKNKGNQRHEVNTNFQTISPLLSNGNVKGPKLFTSDLNEQKAQKVMDDYKLTNFVVVHAGARKELRRWKPSKFAKLCAWLMEKGYEVVLTGGKEDRMVNEEIQNLVNKKMVRLEGELSLLDFAALVNNAKLFVGNESGPLHIASCMETPIVGLYGPGVRDVFYPYYKKSKVIHHVLNCNPCNQVDCITPENTCMDRIEFQDVCLAIEELEER